nr:phage integrase, N-terminal SAM-like domain protein [uncultured bacterium]
MRVTESFHRVAKLHHVADNTIHWYRDWIEDFLRFHKVNGAWRHPRDLRGEELGQYLTHLAADRKVSASSQN